MNYVTDASLEYILNKFHDTKKPFNGLRRFICNDELFDRATGLGEAEMKEGIHANDKKYENRPHSIRKARAVEFVLQNTKIATDARDKYPSVCALNRPVAVLISEWNTKVLLKDIPEANAKRQALNESGTAGLSYDYDHAVPNWDRLFALGVSGIITDTAKHREALAKAKTLSGHEEAFYESVIIIYTAFRDFLLRLAAMAKTENPKMAEALLFLADNPPATFYQCLLLNYTYFIVMEHVDYMQARSLANFDRVFNPYYQKDLARGISREELRSDLAYYLLQFTAIGNYWNQPVFLGGTAEDGSSLINEMSYEFLTVYDEMTIYNPKIQIKLAKNTPKKFVLKALDMIRRGHNSIVFVCEDTMRRALMAKGCTEKEARECNIHGCYEYSAQDSVPLFMLYFNLMKPFEQALSGGYDGVTGKKTGIDTPADFKTFDEFYNAYLAQLSHTLDTAVSIANDMSHYHGEINPQPLLSGSYITAIERGLDALESGAAHVSTGVSFGGIANLADSLSVVEELAFKNHEYTIPELKAILDKNFEGHEGLRQRILKKMDHYGNNKENPDRHALNVVRHVRDYLRQKDNLHGGRWGCSFHVARHSYIWKDSTAASPDGRLRGEELSKNVSPSMGRNTAGATAAILSVTKLEAYTFSGDACLDLGIHPSAAQGEDGLAAMYALLMTFEARGGHAMHINVFDADTLRAAQKYPDSYSDLQIRVCGWNVLFNNISKEEQDGFIRQAEGIA